ncbi:hypothetical protein DKM44_06270 [Deinococcus irradiatisoli]|uniref:Uncharacterized protein n=2 Tax=Deinococcus irradiatisoli TaxID=2202254 RepID=A0A2Z3JCW6_9DEIO|nr:hypothetical protein DKM44_06270 [Deinococcus irradiatisoli]
MLTRRPDSALPRPLDFTYASNRWAAAGLVVGTLAARALGQSWPGSLRTGLGTFSAWAIGRELDPDNSATALGAMPLAFAASLARPQTASDHPEGPGSLLQALPSFTALSSLRVLTASVGAAASVADSTALGLQAAATALSSGSVGALLPGAALELSHRRHDAFSAPPTVGVAALAAGALPAAGQGSGRHVLSDVLSLAALGLGANLAAPERIRSRCDQTSSKLSDDRVRDARLLSLAALGLGLVRRETLTLAPLAAACLSVGVRRFLEK